MCQAGLRGLHTLILRNTLISPAAILQFNGTQFSTFTVYSLNCIKSQVTMNTKRVTVYIPVHFVAGKILHCPEMKEIFLVVLMSKKSDVNSVVMSCIGSIQTLLLILHFEMCNLFCPVKADTNQMEQSLYLCLLPLGHDKLCPQKIQALQLFSQHMMPQKFILFCFVLNRHSRGKGESLFKLFIFICCYLQVPALNSRQSQCI